MSWSLRFAEPIVLADGSKLATLRDAVAHLAKIIPKVERDMPEILTASDLLAQAAEHNGPVEFARIVTLQAINRHVVSEFDPTRKDMHLGPPQAEARCVMDIYDGADWTEMDIDDFDRTKIRLRRLTRRSRVMATMETDQLRSRKWDPALWSIAAVLVAAIVFVAWL